MGWVGRGARLEALVTEAVGLLRLLARKDERTMATLQDLAAEVHKNTSVTGSATMLIKGLADQLQAAKSDPAAIDALIAELRSSDSPLADAVAANTPAAPPAP